MAENLLEIQDLHAGVEDKEILKGLSLTVGKGEVHVILGPNGSGKSTLMNVIMGHPKYTVTSGTMKFEGEDLLAMKTFERARKGLFLSFQTPEEIPGISVENMIRTAKQAITGERVKILPFRKKLRAMMEELKISPEYADRYMNVGFSGGEKKRNEILQLLMLEPKLALLDETDSGLDVDAVQIVSEGVAKFHNDDNSCLIITHNTRILEKLKVDKVHVLMNGEIVEEGGAELIDTINSTARRPESEAQSFMAKKKTFVEDIERTLYDIKDADNSVYKSESGLTEEIIRDISARKHDPEWMLEFRLKSLETYNKLSLPTWGPSLEDLDMDRIITYVQPDAKMTGNWKDVPEDIKDTFDRLGIPEAEQKSLGGVGAQYDSEVVYHSIQEDMVKQGVIYTDMETAIREHEDIVKEYFMKLVPPKDHKFAALHGAVWSGGSFVYVPAGVQVKMPLQSYFRLNAAGAGQFEHTLIIVEPGASLHFIEGCSAPKYNVTNLHAGCVELYVKEGARLRYSTIENWSRNMMNLNTKRALVEKDGIIEWVSGSFGSHVSCLYPCSILHGERAKCEFTGVTFASKGQDLDTGASVILTAPDTSANINTRTISKAGGKATYRSAVKVTENAKRAKCSVNCESLMLDNESRSDTLPVMDIEGDDADVGHEAKIGRISDEAVFYLTCRGIDEDEARAMIVRGFVEPIAKELPLEYAVEMNNLVNIELEGTMG